MIKKIIWLLRGLVYKPFFGHIGKLSYIGKPTYIGKFNRIFIDDKVRIFPGARIEVVDKNSSISLKKNVSIGQNLHIISAEKLVIGKNTTISANVFITNVDHEYSEINTHILNQSLLNKKTEIGENCFIGYGAVIQAGTILGKQCIVGANSVVRGTFPAYSVIVGAPARIVKRYDDISKSWRRTNAKGDFIDE
jgi:acetyltransferase-like isoleucine patch superfamily enzyme